MRKDSKFTKRLIDLETRKSVHINMTRATHAEFRKTLMDFGMSMQEVLQHFASLVAEGDKSAILIVNEAYQKKKNRQIKKITDMETENLYDAISFEDPFEK